MLERANMKILLTHAYTKDNKGDAAIVSVLLQQLHSAFPDASITISTYDDDARYEAEEHQVLSNSMYIGVYRFRFLPCKLLYSFYIENTLLLWALLYRLSGYSLTALLPECTRAMAHEYLASDLFVAAGGGYLRAKKGIQEDINIILLLNPLVIGILLRKPIILYTQSVGPFATTFQEWMIRVVLNRTQHIFVREEHTVATLKEIGVKTRLVTRTIDAGFLFDSDKAFQLSDILEDAETLKSDILVGITVRKWLSQEGQHKFEKAIASFVDRITQEKRVRILFIPQVTSTVHNDDDRDVAKRIVELVSNKQSVINCTDSYDHFQLKQLYGHLDFLVGTRFHSVIFSLTSYVPALAIEYEYKTGGIMKDLGLSDWVIPIEQVTAENLYEKFIQLWNEGDLYKQKLHRVVPEYALKATEVESQMKEIYYSLKHRSLSSRAARFFIKKVTKNSI
jgi:colanic acid/amylovoran biosynthesis protein